MSRRCMFQVITCTYANIRESLAHVMQEEEVVAYQ